MLQIIGGARALRTATALGRVVTCIGGVAMLGCEGDWSGPWSPGPGASPSVATAPDIRGSYTGSGSATVTWSGGSRTFTCAGTADIPAQPDSTFAGTFLVVSAGDCDETAGTLWGTVRPDGSVTLMADTPGGGANVWEDAAARTGCALVSSTPFDGTLVSHTVTVAGNAIYDCVVFGRTVRFFVTAEVTATRE